jgi:hypothetical protein
MTACLLKLPNSKIAGCVCLQTRTDCYLWHWQLVGLLSELLAPQQLLRSEVSVQSGLLSLFAACGRLLRSP